MKESTQKPTKYHLIIRDNGMLYIHHFDDFEDAKKEMKLQKILDRANKILRCEPADYKIYETEGDFEFSFAIFNYRNEMMPQFGFSSDHGKLNLVCEHQAMKMYPDAEMHVDIYYPYGYVPSRKAKEVLS